MLRFSKIACLVAIVGGAKATTKSEQASKQSQALLRGSAPPSRRIVPRICSDPIRSQLRLSLRCQDGTELLACSSLQHRTRSDFCSAPHQGWADLQCQRHGGFDRVLPQYSGCYPSSMEFWTGFADRLSETGYPAGSERGEEEPVSNLPGLPHDPPGKSISGVKARSFKRVMPTLEVQTNITTRANASKIRGALDSFASSRWATNRVPPDTCSWTVPVPPLNPAENLDFEGMKSREDFPGWQVESHHIARGYTQKAINFTKEDEDAIGDAKDVPFVYLHCDSEDCKARHTCISYQGRCAVAIEAGDSVLHHVPPNSISRDDFLVPMLDDVCFPGDDDDDVPRFCLNFAMRFVAFDLASRGRDDFFRVVVQLLDGSETVDPEVAPDRSNPSVLLDRIRSVSQVGDMTDSSWELIEVPLPRMKTGSMPLQYSLRAYVTNAIDSLFDSVGLIDDVRVERCG